MRITGGEPLSHPDFPELFRYARNAGFDSLALQTNGMLFDGASVALLSSLDFPGFTIQISMDGAGAKTHDAVRGTGAFQALLQGIRQLVRAGLGKRVAIFFTEMRHNLEDLPAALELVEDLGVGWFTSGTVVLCGRAAEDALVAPPAPEQYRRLLERYDSDADFQRRYRRLAKIPVIEWRGGDTPRGEACTFVENPYLSAEGRLYPCLLCHADPFSVHDVFRKSLSDAFIEGAALWSELLHASRRRAHQVDACKDCPEHLTCAAGCVGRAWGSCGEIMAPDDRCTIRREARKMV